MNTLDTLYHSLKEEAILKSDVAIKSQTHVIHGAVYYLVTSSKEPICRKLASFDRNEISSGTKKITWTANTAIDELALLSDLFLSLTCK